MRPVGTAQTTRERFLREARAAAALRHPNVAAVYHFGASPDGAHFYYAMELVEGETLETLSKGTVLLIQKWPWKLQSKWRRH